MGHGDDLSDSRDWSAGYSRAAPPRRVIQISMPNFNEKEDLVESFLSQFEKLATIHRVPQEQWAINVSAFLQGSAKEVYHNLGPDDVDNYEALKAALVKHYELTTEVYRKMFRDAQKKATETHHQYHTRVKTLFDKWIRKTGASKSYEGLREELLKEQVMGSYRKDLAIFLTERGFGTLDEVADMAERYELAHAQPGSNHRRDKPPDVMRPEENSELPPRQDGVQSKPQNQPTNSRSNRQVEERRGLCFKCQKPGHQARECRSRPFSVNALFPVMNLHLNGQPKDYANTTPVMVNGSEATALLDTGCRYPVLVHERHIREEDRTTSA